jgi:hypothetical protein
MSLRKHFRTDTTSVANSFLMLVMVAGVLNIDLFESDVVNGDHDHRVHYRIELVFNTEPPAQFPGLSISQDIPGNDVVDRILPSHYFTECFGTTLFVIQKTDQASTTPIYSSHYHTSSFNIPHQNSDEDEAFIFPADVA